MHVHIYIYIYVSVPNEMLEINLCYLTEEKHLQTG